tara:strand:- start:1024 stop:1287 length:264 start_codon:yes stop_codon:yes gene_type:complete
MNRRNLKLTKKIEEILGEDELLTEEILQGLKNLENNKAKNNWYISFTPNQVYNLLKRKQFEKAGYDEKLKQTIWRNKNVVDRKIQTE